MSFVYHESVLMKHDHFQNLSEIRLLGVQKNEGTVVSSPGKCHLLETLLLPF